MYCSVVFFNIIKCVIFRVKNRNSILTKHEVKCEYTSKGKSIKIFLIEPVGVAYLGASDMGDVEKIKEVKPIKIDYVIRHEKSYRGGGRYGNYGGYDITLLHLGTS